ncbi:coiled-coil domain-containing protein 178, partial [Manis pentadactyla]|uniref:coiled-coil domain-containing protein 178 n=1 Tax=Manis pentadactyla TaxID=143292 RepID=UPI00255C67A0
NATSQALVLFGAHKEAIEISHKNKMTNTEGVNKSIFFSYPCRRQSCALVNIPAPCVNKMISHIEDVGSKIQEHLKWFETSFEEWSRTSSTKDLKEEGSLASPVKEVKSEEKKDEKCSELKQDMEMLLSEAIYLIRSLETDRAEAEEALKQQKSRKEKIVMKIDSWSVWRLQEIPLAVQKEHEAYLRDIIELQWHLENKAHQLKHFEEQKAKLEEANAKLEADIEHMSELGPLLKSKWNHELEALKDFYHRKFEIMKLHEQILKELEETIENCENAKSNAQRTREDFEKDIYNDETSIDAYKREVGKLSDMCAHYCTSAECVSVSMEESEKAVTKALKETKTSEGELLALSKTLDNLKRFYDNLVWKKKGHEKAYLEALNDFYAAKSAWDIELSNVAKDFSDISIAYTQLMEENRKIGIDIETITGSINDSIKTKSDFESKIQSLIKLRSKNGDYLKQLYKEAYHIGAVFQLTKLKTEELEEKITEVRRKFKGREEFLKRLTQGEVANGTVIQKRLLSIQEGQVLEKQEFTERRTKYALELADMEGSLLQLENDATRLRAAHQEHWDSLNNIIERREYVKRNLEKTKKKLQRKGKKTHVALMQSEAKCSIIFKELEDTKSKTITYHTKINQLNKDLEEQQKEKKMFDQILENLKEQFLTMRYKKEHIQAVFDHLTSEKKVCEERIYEEDQRYRTLITMRQKTLADVKVSIDDSLKENLRLAQEYQKLQTTFLTEKDHYFNLYNEQLSLGGSLRDKKQAAGCLPMKFPSSLVLTSDDVSDFQTTLCQLQERIHKVWQKHFRLVVLYSRMRLARFQTDSRESIQKILAVQEESSHLMQHIVDFFQTLTDGSCENDG